MPRSALYLAILVLGLTIGAPAQAAKRVALLVGNGAYENVPRLQTAVNDARALGGALRRLGFTVTVAENQSRRTLSEAFIAFDKAIEPGDVALLFFAGHGFEIHGQNYLLPVDVPAAGEGQEELIVDSAFTAERLVGRMQARGARTVILVLDACRNNPFERPGGRGTVGRGGLAPMTPVEGVFIVFAAGAKQIALDRLAASEKAQNSLFTRNLLVQLAEPGLTLVQIAKRLQADVRNMAAAVGHDQTPAYYDQVVGDVVLNGEDAAAPQPGGDSATKVATLPPALARPLLRPEIGGTEPPPPADPGIEELDALAAAQSWQELRAYLVKVKPTARDAHWASLVEQAAVGELTRLASADHYTARLAAIDDFDTAFPSLRGSSKYRALRASVGLDAWRQCFEADRWGSSAGYCYQGLTGFVRTPPLSAELARGAARIAARGLNQGAAAPLLALAAEAPDSASICAEADLPQWLANALVKSPDWDQPKAAVSLIDKCWDTVGPAMVAEFARHGAGSYYPSNTCPTLMKRNALTGYRAALCREIMAR
jgi:hypothetical protein